MNESLLITPQFIQNQKNFEIFTQFSSPHTKKTASSLSEPERELINRKKTTENIIFVWYVSR